MLPLEGITVGFLHRVKRFFFNESSFFIPVCEVRERILTHFCQFLLEFGVCWEMFTADEKNIYISRANTQLPSKSAFNDISCYCFDLISSFQVI